MLGNSQLYGISLANTFGSAIDIAKVSDDQVRRPNSALPNAWLRRKSDSESDSRARRCLVPHGALRASSARLPARCSGRPHGGCLLAGTRARWPRRRRGQFDSTRRWRGIRTMRGGRSGMRRSTWQLRAARTERRPFAVPRAGGFDRVRSSALRPRNVERFATTYATSA